MQERKRVLVKFSGEALAGENGFGIENSIFKIKQQMRLKNWLKTI